MTASEAKTETEFGNLQWKRGPGSNVKFLDYLKSWPMAFNDSTSKFTFFSLPLLNLASIQVTRNYHYLQSFSLICPPFRPPLLLFLINKVPEGNVLQLPLLSVTHSQCTKSIPQPSTPILSHVLVPDDAFHTDTQPCTHTRFQKHRQIWLVSGMCKYVMLCECVPACVTVFLFPQCGSYGWRTFSQ